MLARNTPIALVVGAAGFFGSHLVDKLLTKGIQVVGTDDLTYSKKENLSEAIENKNFHLIIETAENLDLELDRLDYIFICEAENLFIASPKEIKLGKILELFQDHKCRMLFISSVELYGEDASGGSVAWLKKAESGIARAAKENNLNARILRLGPLFGPRMSFDKSTSIARLIHSSLKDELQKEVSLEFSSRALYIDDAIELAIKCIFAGATAQKIFDGVLPAPIKVSDIKQVLLDPVWYEEKGFNPQELPPWTTPNLERTIKFLHWQPGTNLVEGLRKTLSYFKDKEIKIEEMGDEPPTKQERQEDKEWKMAKAEELEGLRKGEGEKKKINFKFSGIYSAGVLLLIASLIIYGLVWPVAELSWGVLTFRLQLLEAVKALGKGDFDTSLLAVQQAEGGVTQADAIFYSLEPLRKTGILKSQFEVGDNLSNLANLSVASAQNTILGVQALFQATKAVTGEFSDDPVNYFEEAKIDLALADEDLSKAFALMDSADFKSGVPRVLEGRIKSLKDRLGLYSSLVKKARAVSVLLPEVVGQKVSKNYLVLLQNNMELRPGGGFIGSFAKVSFEAGKLKKLEVNDVYAIDGQLKIHVEPPKEIKQDLDQKDFFLRDSNWEPDFPTAARQAEWFYTKETGERVEGVVALDTSAAADLLSVLGPLDLSDYNEKITSDNLFERSIAHSEVGFFPGSQAKKSFLTSLTQALFNNLFFLPNQNWPGVVSSLGRSLQQKHLSIYLDNPALFSYLISQNWASVMPRAGAEKTPFVADFLAPVEANLGANKANYYLDRNYNLETVIGKDGEVNHRLRIAYTNRSPSNAFPAGKYKNRMRVYLPSETKLNRVLWGEKDITKEVSSFSDYGRLGLSFLLELAPKEQKILVLDYQIGQSLKFIANSAKYRLDIIKQAGTLKDPLFWRVTFPLNLKLSSNQAQKIGPQEQTIQTDLSQDRSFELEFTK
ncbi:MAG: Uncharacterized protein G01um10147_330 [Microgenomates group bacterium Gr01-1014_7]|nr:MAG: Uncharacterized protein G01um10147_330 [Microgenomates group bacterium Gr01-1014_7]